MLDSEGQWLGQIYKYIWELPLKLCISKSLSTCSVPLPKSASYYVLVAFVIVVLSVLSLPESEIEVVTGIVEKGFPAELSSCFMYFSPHQFLPSGSGFGTPSLVPRDHKCWHQFRVPSIEFPSKSDLSST